MPWLTENGVWHVDVARAASVARSDSLVLGGISATLFAGARTRGSRASPVREPWGYHGCHTRHNRLIWPEERPELIEGFVQAERPSVTHFLPAIIATPF